MNSVAEQVKNRLLSKPQVRLYYNDELAKGEWIWSVEDMTDDSQFWLESFDTEQEAREYCGNNGLTVSEVMGDKNG